MTGQQEFPVGCDEVETPPRLASAPNRRTSSPESDFDMTPQAAVAPTPTLHAADAVLQVAQRLYKMEPDWVVFFREVLGVDGIVRRTFGDAEALVRFECSPQYSRIREMLDSLRSRQQEQAPEREALRVVTVRMPRSLHETLKEEAGQLRVSINTLCISKLMKLLDEQEHRDMTEGRQLTGGTEPDTAGGRRNRRPKQGRAGADL